MRDSRAGSSNSSGTYDYDSDDESICRIRGHTATLELSSKKSSRAGICIFMARTRPVAR